MVCCYKLIWGEIFFMSSMKWRLLILKYFDIACNNCKISVNKYTDIQVVNYHKDAYVLLFV